jgi:uncharacterized protein DUF6361
MSSIGWIDFSSTDRKRAHEALALMKEAGTLDELGIGQIRDAYSDALFPGFSTVQTNARYFLAIPKLLLDWADLSDAKRRQHPLHNFLRTAENELASALKKNHVALGKKLDGVIGHTVAEEGGVARRPSSSYWNGLRTFDIVRTQRSLAEFCRYWQQDRDYYDAVSSDEGSDDDDARFEAAVRRPPKSHGPWPKDMTLRLTKPEAEFLRQRFSCAPGVGNTVAAQLLSNELARKAVSKDYANFGDFSQWAEGQHMLSVVCRKNIESAQRFSLAIEGAHIIFNRLIAREKNDDVLLGRCKERYAMWRTATKLARIFTPGAEQQWLSVNEARQMRVKDSTEGFLAEWNRLHCTPGTTQAKLDELVHRQGVRNKPDRSLLIRLPREKADWYGMSALDYRWRTAQRMLKDVVEVLLC